MDEFEGPTGRRAAPLAPKRCHCGDWAGFGFGRGDLEKHWCWVHYPYKTAGRLEAAEVAEGLMEKVA